MQKLAGVIGIGLVLVVGVGFSQSRGKQDRVPNVSGAWSGVWGIYSPPALEGAATPNGLRLESQQPMECKKMDCRVEPGPGGRWQATFEGECGRPYRYTIKMVGRTVGSAVLFQGTADLGEKDGGVFDWIGRAGDQEFVGFFTSKGYTGTFRLARAK